MSSTWDREIAAPHPRTAPSESEAKDVADHQLMLSAQPSLLRTLLGLHDPRGGNPLFLVLLWRSPAMGSPSDLALWPPSNKRKRTSGRERNVSLPARSRGSMRHARGHLCTQTLFARGTRRTYTARKQSYHCHIYTAVHILYPQSISFGRGVLDHVHSDS